MIRICLFGALFAALAACEPEGPLTLPGTTEWDRVSVLAEASEPIIEWKVAEGDRVDAGQILLRLDSSRFDTRISRAEAALDEGAARLAELESGPRQETIDRARAELSSAEAAAAVAEIEFTRVSDLLERQLTSEQSVDQALAVRDQRRAAVAGATAVLDELLAGTRSEAIDAASARARVLRAELEELLETRARLDVRAPRNGRIDVLPFRPGDQPRVGDILATMLVGERPIARIFVPADVRGRITAGDRFEVKVVGIDRSYQAELRSIRSEASFTPYYALSGDDASRLVYRAELLITDADAADLPAGLPLVAIPLASSR